MTEWEIKPFTSVGPIPFGIDIEEAERLLGTPVLEFPERSFNNYQDDVRLMFRPDIVDEVSISGDTSLDIILFGINLFKDNKMSVLQELEKRNDGPVYDSNAFLIFSKFGMLLTGVHDDDESQRAVSLSDYDSFAEYFLTKEQSGTLTPITFL